jgi:hypothetical protein
VASTATRRYRAIVRAGAPFYVSRKENANSYDPTSNEACAMEPCTFDDFRSSRGKDPRNECVGRFGAKSDGGKSPFRKMPYVVGDDGLCLGSDCRCNDMDVRFSGPDPGSRRSAFRAIVDGVLGRVCRRSRRPSECGDGRRPYGRGECPSSPGSKDKGAIP